MIGALVYVGLAILFVMDAVRMRKRMASLDHLPAGAPSPTGGEQDPRVVTASGSESEPLRATYRVVSPASVEMPATLAAALTDQARRIRALYVDVVPERAPVDALWAFAQLTDPVAARQRTAEGRTAGYAVLAARRLFDNAGLVSESSVLEVPSAAALVRLAREIRPYASDRVRFVIAEGFSTRVDPYASRETLDEAVGGMSRLAAVVPVLLVLLLWVGAVFIGWPAWVAIAAFHLQHVIGFAGTRVRPTGIVLRTLFRTPIELIRGVRLLVGPRSTALEQQADAVRPAYAAMLANGLEPFFESRRSDCPMCGSADIRRLLRFRDHIQHKPGRFELDRCGACGHTFQNPKLSIEGLSFYYRDFYDGLGERQTAAMFAVNDEPYRNRAAMVLDRLEPASWLDVGCGHGHFAAVLKDTVPSIEVHGLDLSESVEEAAKRGWVDHGIRALFPERAAELADRYDVVSMFHYLEHTVAPERELDAAATAVRPGGHVVIEVPDPDCKLGLVLRTFWFPWFQPQHQHFVRCARLCEMLEARGFEMVAVHRKEAHQPADFFLSTLIVLHGLAPSPLMPWRPPLGPVGRAWHGFVWTFGLFGLGLARLFDAILSSIVPAVFGSNTYRVLARKVR